MASNNIRRLVGLGGYNQRFNDVIFAQNQQQQPAAEVSNMVVFFGGDVQVIHNIKHFQKIVC